MVLRAIRLKRYLLSKLIQDLNLFGDPQRFRGERIVVKSWLSRSPLNDSRGQNATQLEFRKKAGIFFHKYVVRFDSLPAHCPAENGR